MIKVVKGGSRPLPRIWQTKTAYSCMLWCSCGNVLAISFEFSVPGFEVCTCGKTYRVELRVDEVEIT